MSSLDSSTVVLARGSRTRLRYNGSARLLRRPIDIAFNQTLEARRARIIGGRLDATMSSP